MYIISKCQSLFLFFLTFHSSSGLVLSLGHFPHWSCSYRLSLSKLSKMKRLERFDHTSNFPGPRDGFLVELPQFHYREIITLENVGSHWKLKIFILCVGIKLNTTMKLIFWPLWIAVKVTLKSMIHQLIIILGIASLHCYIDATWYENWYVLSKYSWSHISRFQ